MGLAGAHNSKSKPSVCADPRAVEMDVLGDAPRTLLEEFAKIKSRDVVLQAQSGEGGPTRTIRLRWVPEPDATQKVLLSRLGLTLPRRLRWIDEDTKALTANGHGTDENLPACHTSGR